MSDISGFNPDLGGTKIDLPTSMSEIDIGSSTVKIGSQALFNGALCEVDTYAFSSYKMGNLGIYSIFYGNITYAFVVVTKNNPCTIYADIVTRHLNGKPFITKYQKDCIESDFAPHPEIPGHYIVGVPIHQKISGYVSMGFGSSDRSVAKWKDLTYEAVPLEIGGVSLISRSQYHIAVDAAGIIPKTKYGNNAGSRAALGLLVGKINYILKM